MFTKKTLLASLSVVTASLFAGVASATSVADTAAATITSDGGAAITAVGGALIGIAATAVVFKWAKGAIFG